MEAKNFTALPAGDTAKYAVLRFRVEHENGRWAVCWLEPGITKHGRELLKRFGRFRVDVGDPRGNPHIESLYLYCRRNLCSWGEVVEYVDSVRAQVAAKFEELERQNAVFPNERLEEFYVNV